MDQIPQLKKKPTLIDKHKMSKHIIILLDWFKSLKESLSSFGEIYFFIQNSRIHCAKISWHRRSEIINYVNWYFSYFNIIPNPFQSFLSKNAKFEWNWVNWCRKKVENLHISFRYVLVISPWNPLCLNILDANFIGNCLSRFGEVYF